MSARHRPLPARLALLPGRACAQALLTRHGFGKP